MIGTRTVLPFDTVLAAGETIFIKDNTPSLLYFEGDTNEFSRGLGVIRTDLRRNAVHPDKLGHGEPVKGKHPCSEVLQPGDTISFKARAATNRFCGAQLSV